MEHPVGGVGFFECVDNKEAAFTLFDAARSWLTERGMVGMDGPINFGERDRFWGLLVQGFSPGAYMENYNPPYYQQFFEDYGFRLYFKQTSYQLLKSKFSAERFGRVAERIMRKPEYKFEHLNLKQLDRFAADFVHIYNTAWHKFENFKPVTQEEMLAAFRQMKPIIVPDYVWFAYVNGEPAGFSVMVPDVNEIFKYVHGKLNLWGKLKFLVIKKIKPIQKLRGLVFGFLPQYQNLGLDAAIVYCFYLATEKIGGVEEVGISWVGDFNPKMNSFMEAFQGKVDKVHHTYRKLFDESIPFKHYSIE
jgi:hypothetical protein